MSEKKTTTKRTSKKVSIDTMDVSLQSPWVIYGKMLIGLLTPDPDITITTNYDEGRYTVSVFSDNSAKLAALNNILKNYIQMGNITFVIEYEGIDSDEDELTDITKPEDWVTAFTGNPNFVSVIKAVPGVPFSFTYAVFARNIISIFSDDLTDYCGNSHFIAADIVKNVAKSSNVHPCTSAV